MTPGKAVGYMLGVLLWVGLGYYIYTKVKKGK